MVRLFVCNLMKQPCSVGLLCGGREVRRWRLDYCLVLGAAVLCYWHMVTVPASFGVQTCMKVPLLFDVLICLEVLALFIHFANWGFMNEA